MQPQVLSVFLDYRCNYECAHCSVGSSPRTIMPAPDHVLERVYEALDAMPSFKVVAFTGGEPTMRKSALLAAVREVKKRKVVVRIVTNGWWAATREKAESWIREFTEAGVDEISTSFDDYHAEFGNIEKLGNLVRAALPTKLRIAVAIIHQPGNSYTADRVKEDLSDLLNVSVAELDRTIWIVDDQPTPTGTASTLNLTPNDEPFEEMGCRQVMHTLSVHPDASVKACCGHGMFYAPDLTLGSLEENSLMELADGPLRNILYMMIHSVGPQRLLRMIGVDHELRSKCHACTVLLTDHRETLIDYLLANRDELFTSHVMFDDTFKQVSELMNRKGNEIVERIERDTAIRGRAGDAARQGTPIQLVRKDERSRTDDVSSIGSEIHA